MSTQEPEPSSLSFSRFALEVKPEGAFEVLALAKTLIAAGKDVIELEIGDSPYPAPSAAVALRAGHVLYNRFGLWMFLE